MGKDGQEGRMSDERQQYGIPENISEKEDTQSQKVFGDSGGGNICQWDLRPLVITSNNPPTQLLMKLSTPAC